MFKISAARDNLFVLGKKILIFFNLKKVEKLGYILNCLKLAYDFTYKNNAINILKFYLKVAP